MRLAAGQAVMSLRKALFGKAFKERPGVVALFEEHKKSSAGERSNRCLARRSIAPAASCDAPCPLARIREASVLRRRLPRCACVAGSSARPVRSLAHVQTWATGASRSSSPTPSGFCSTTRSEGTRTCWKLCQLFTPRCSGQVSSTQSWRHGACSAALECRANG